ncbi:MAG: hypothetical protein ACRDOA_17605 [Streptosporangiaceae bacterium]
MDLHGRSLLKETDLNAEEFGFLVEEARRLRADERRGVTGRRLAGRNIALIFEKTSTRTRSAFEVGAHDEGGHVTYLGPGESQLGHEESVKDTARVLGRMFDGIEYRGFAQESIEIIRGYGTPDAQPIRAIDTVALSAMTFPAGSMGPKVEACIRFVTASGQPAVIGALTDAADVLAGRAGTTISR